MEGIGWTDMAQDSGNLPAFVTTVAENFLTNRRTVSCSKVTLLY